MCVPRCTAKMEGGRGEEGGGGGGRENAALPLFVKPAQAAPPLYRCASTQRRLLPLSLPLSLPSNPFLPLTLQSLSWLPPSVRPSVLFSMSNHAACPFLDVQSREPAALFSHHVQSYVCSIDGCVELLLLCRGVDAAHNDLHMPQKSIKILAQTRRVQTRKRRDHGPRMRCSG